MRIIVYRPVIDSTLVTNLVRNSAKIDFRDKIWRKTRTTQRIRFRENSFDPFDEF